MRGKGHCLRLLEAAASQRLADIIEESRQPRAILSKAVTTAKRK